MDLGPKTLWDLKLTVSVLGGLASVSSWPPKPHDYIVLASIVLNFIVTGTMRPATTPPTK